MPVDLTASDVILINSSGGKDSQTLLHHIATQAHQQAVTDRVTVLHCALGHVEWPAPPSWRSPRPSTTGCAMNNATAHCWTRSRGGGSGRRRRPA